MVAPSFGAAERAPRAVPAAVLDRTVDLLLALGVRRARGHQPLLRGVTLRLAPGVRVGLVGANGAGKSTLLRILAGVEPPDDGRVVRAPGVRLAYLPQDDPEPGPPEATVWHVGERALAPVRELEARLREEERRIAAGDDRAAAYASLRAEFDGVGGYGAEARLREHLAALGFASGAFARHVATLSAGERRRLSLAAALAAAPDVLLLDEPTNHLDLSTRAWLAERLNRHAGALVVVSHDRALLDACTTHTAFLRAGALTLVPGRYALARRRHDGAQDASERRAKERAKEAERLARMAEELRAFGHKAQRRRKAAERRRDELRRRDGLRRATGGSHPEAPTVAGGGPPRPSLHREAHRSDRPRAGGPLVTARHLASGDAVRGATLRIDAGDRIVVLGPNGSGKSTLLALLRGDLPSTDPRSELHFAARLKLVFVDQRDRGLDPRRPLLEQLAEALGDGAAKHLLAEAGVPHAAWHHLPGDVSGGERARAGLAFALTRDADLWMLDEPTNDLDLAAVEALQEALEDKLAGGKAALLLVTHDRALAERMGGQVWGMDAGIVRRYADVTAYLAGRPLAVEPADPADEDAAAGDVHEAGGVGDVHEADGVAGVHEVAGPSDDDLAAFEDERLEVLRRLSDPLALSERDAERLTARLAALEQWLMEAYDARLARPQPRHRIVEHGVTLFADVLSPVARDGAQTAAELAVVAAPEPVAAATFDQVAHAADRHDPPAAVFAAQPWLVAWVEVRRVDGVAHLRLVERSDTCLLPRTRVALLDGAARAAFTLLGAEAVQCFDRAPLPGTRLRPAGDGWWSLGRGEFLRLEGWGERATAHASLASSRTRRRRRKRG